MKHTDTAEFIATRLYKLDLVVLSYTKALLYRMQEDFKLKVCLENSEFRANLGNTVKKIFSKQ